MLSSLSRASALLRGKLVVRRAISSVVTIQQARSLQFQKSIRAFSAKSTSLHHSGQADLASKEVVSDGPVLKKLRVQIALIRDASPKQLADMSSDDKLSLHRQLISSAEECGSTLKVKDMKKLFIALEVLQGDTSNRKIAHKQSILSVVENFLSTVPELPEPSFEITDRKAFHMFMHRLLKYGLYSTSISNSLVHQVDAQTRSFEGDENQLLLKILAVVRKYYKSSLYHKKYDAESDRGRIEGASAMIEHTLEKINELWISNDIRSHQRDGFHVAMNRLQIAALSGVRRHELPDPKRYGTKIAKLLRLCSALRDEEYPAQMISSCLNLFKDLNMSWASHVDFYSELVMFDRLRNHLESGERSISPLTASKLLFALGDTNFHVAAYRNRKENRKIQFEKNFRKSKPYIDLEASADAEKVSQALLRIVLEENGTTIASAMNLTDALQGFSATGCTIEEVNWGKVVERVYWELSRAVAFSTLDHPDESLSRRQISYNNLRTLVWALGKISLRLAPGGGPALPQEYHGVILETLLLHDDDASMTVRQTTFPQQHKSRIANNLQALSRLQISWKGKHDDIFEKKVVQMLEDQTNPIPARDLAITMKSLALHPQNGFSLGNMSVTLRTSMFKAIDRAIGDMGVKDVKGISSALEDMGVRDDSLSPDELDITSRLAESLKEFQSKELN